MAFRYQTTISDAWIDYNGHMRDAYYGLVFSLAVDSLQDEVGFDEAYRKRTGCTIYLIEDHRHYLREVGAGQRVVVDTDILAVDEKRFHLHMVMRSGGEPACVGEYMELHVRQKPVPRAIPMPSDIRSILEDHKITEPALASIRFRAGPMAIRR